jgi:hypothetical protein
MAAGLATLESSPEGIVFAFRAGGIEYGTVELSGSTYSTVSLDGSASLAEFGLPTLPVYRVWLEIPVGAEPEVRIDDAVTDVVSGPAWPVAPGIMSAEKNDPRSSYTVGFDESVYVSGRPYPETPVRIVEGGMMRGRNLALVEVMPLRWNPADNTFELLEEAVISIDYTGGDIPKSFALADRYRAEGFEQIISGTVVNYGTFEVNAGVDTPPAPYLIIGDSDFTDTVMDAFVAHKQAAGFEVTMVDLSVTGTSYSQIEAYILDAIENWANPPVYVLLVGDVNYVPGNVATTYSGVTDLYYVCLDDGGYYPDAFIGRFSVQNTAECNTMAQRVIDYESPGTASGSWIQNTCWIASSDHYTVTEGTHNYCIDNFLAPRGYTWDKIYPVTYGSTAANAVASINGGVSMLTFSGHGSTTSWGDMSFGQSNFNQLNNDGMYPGVLSHACQTGDYSVGTAWCETWTRTGGRGGLWFFGSVPSTYWDEDDIMERAEFEYFLEDDIYWPMGFGTGGKLAVYEYYSGGGASKYYFEGYNLMGDPSVWMWTWPDVTGIEDETTGLLPAGLAIQVPNPLRSGGMVTITGSIGPATLEVYDISGRVVARPFDGQLTSTESFVLNTSDLATGVYFLRLTQAGEVTSSKVTVIR